jgi:hypothetical protein
MIPRKIRMIKDLVSGDECIPAGLESIKIYPGNGIDGSRPSRVLFWRDGVHGMRGVRGLPIGAVPIFDLKAIEGFYEVSE